jgi:UDP-N-acetylglucosamine--N-acetylmuramyl-(pentapeptide) pyrophosphoryl-undecaprenol N-acetylglucosamine transferase
MRVIISGGGTGGHIYPAISIAQALKRRADTVEILFVGAKGKMEMVKVPSSGFPIVGIDIMGLKRSFSFSNLLLPFKLWRSLRQARTIINEFQPDVAIGVGGYASGPLLKVASDMNIPIFLQEQNSYAGLTNRILAKNAEKVFVAYEGMEKFFPKSKIIRSGNPVRKDLLNLEAKKKLGYQHFSLDPLRKTVLIFGGSLGAKTLNEIALSAIETMENNSNIQLLWQTGSYYYERMKSQPLSNFENVKTLAFLERMDLAYAVADVVICRAGALSISELALCSKASVLVPSPHVAEDHQTRNAEALASEDAAIMVEEKYAVEKAFSKALEILNDDELKERISRNIAFFARPNADEKIVNVVFEYFERKKNV